MTPTQFFLIKIYTEYESLNSCRFYKFREDMQYVSPTGQSQNFFHRQTQKHVQTKAVIEIQAQTASE
jgi:hypothetical protein